MDAFTHVWNQMMSAAVFAGMLASILLFVALIAPKSNFGSSINRFMHRNILFIGFFISFAALVSSLVYSNVIGYEPCLLCWYARVALYPQVIIFAMAVFKREHSVVDYTLGLTVFGLIITSYHSYIQWVGEAPLPCSAGGVSCVTRFVFEYGFITIPFMGFVGLLVLFLSLLSYKRAAKQVRA